MTLKVKINDPHFQYQPGESQEHICCKFGDLAQIHYTLLNRQAKFSISQNVQMPLKVKVNDPQFQYQMRVSQDACLVQIW